MSINAGFIKIFKLMFIHIILILLNVNILIMLLYHICKVGIGEFLNA